MKIAIAGNRVPMLINIYDVFFFQLIVTAVVLPRDELGKGAPAVRSNV